MDQIEPGPRRGRPRSQESRHAVLAAAFDLLTEAGLAPFTIEGVAARSGVARTTIYRWWPTKGSLIAESFLEATRSDIAFPITASPIADLRMQMKRVARLLRGP